MNTYMHKVSKMVIECAKENKCGKNIVRKYIKKSNPNQEIAMDNGREQRPLKRRVA